MKVPSTLPEDRAPSASVGHHLKARAAPAHPGAPPEQPGGPPWPQQLASGRRTVCACVRCDHQVACGSFFVFIYVNANITSLMLKLNQRLEQCAATSAPISPDLP